jgi:hypothetical protein
MVVRWQVEATARGSSAVPNRYGEEDERGAIFFFGKLGQFRRAQLLPSFLLLLL